MRASLRNVVLILGLPAPALATPAVATGPGCTYIQPQVKQCSVSAIGGIGTFDVLVAPPASLVVAFDDAVTGIQPPPTTSYRTSFSATTATVVPIRRDPIPGATVHIDTATVHVTLNLKLGPTADTQLLIVDPRKAVRDEEVERRIKEATVGLEDRARARADEILVGELAGGIEVAEADVTPSRHDQVILRARKLVRLGERRVLILSIENRGAEPVDVKRIRIWVARSGAERELPTPAYGLQRTSVPVNEETTAAVNVAKLAAAGDRLRVRVEFTDSERSVELADVRVR